MSDVQHPSRFAATAPDRPAVIMGSGEVLTYGELEERSCRVANLLRSVGCDTGSHLAVLVENRLEYFEVIWAGLRAGLYVTPINWHLAAAEAAYIVEDCGASALVASSTFGDVVAGLDVESDVLTDRFAVGASCLGTSTTRRRSPPSPQRRRATRPKATGCSTPRAPRGARRG